MDNLDMILTFSDPDSNSDRTLQLISDPYSNPTRLVFEEAFLNVAKAYGTYLPYGTFLYCAFSF